MGLDKLENNAACNVVQHDQFGDGSVMVWGSISMQARQRHTQYNGTVVPGFLQLHDKAWLHVARVCMHFLEDEVTDTTDWAPKSNRTTLVCYVSGYLMLPGCTSDYLGAQ